MDAIALSIFASRLAAACDEMGAVLRAAAFSPNIRDRLDFSCAVFDPTGALCAQAAHIPVHLGSMAYAMASVVEARDWAPGDMLVFNDPDLGGTHLPDITLVAPVFAAAELVGFVASRAHHADIGATAPGSMPLSRSREEEGLLIPPQPLLRQGEVDAALLARMVARAADPRAARGDFAAQISANRIGVERVAALAGSLGPARFAGALEALNDYGERLARTTLARIPDGCYRHRDLLDDDGFGHLDIPVAVELRVAGDTVEVDFAGTAGPVEGNLNCPLAVTAAAVYYAFRCLMPPQTPAAAGSFRPIRLQVPEGSLLDARHPAAVAAGNVETSSRIVDVVLGALARALPEEVPAASQGTMNNMALGGVGPRGAWAYYETIGGGMGAGPRGGGLSGVQTHMTNTLNTPVEVLEATWPVRVRRYALRRGSGGSGLRPGGDGLVRSLELLAPARLTLLTERRRHAPWGLAGGEPGARGVNRINGEVVAGKLSRVLAAGDLIEIETPGGGGWGSAAETRQPAPGRQ